MHVGKHQLKSYLWRHLKVIADVALYAIWLREPNVKGSDVIAIRHDGKINVSDISGIQFVDGPVENAIGYDMPSSNIQKFSNGVGIPMNLKDGSKTFALRLYVSGTISGNATIYGSYQHAKQNIGLANSKNYTLSKDGYGRVLKFSGKY